ncbi:MAG: adenosine kinase [Bacteroidales bacterium]|jgi:sugar/nucleoside kinase (ribokinase family)|nr:adenosine kinase [Bacteroidales bacterium]
MNKTKKVLGLGNALVDIMTQLEDESLLKDFGLPKGSMQLVDKTKSDQVVDGTRHLKTNLAAGGSAANTINGLAKLGVDCGFIGKIGKDSYGEFFSNDMIASGIQPLLIQSDTESGRAVALVSPDSERTFATYLGASVELSDVDLKPENFSGYDYLHIEGYLVQNHALIEKALQLAKAEGLVVSLDLASYNIVEENLAFLRDMSKKYVDILYANEEEARAFTGEENPEKALDIIAETVDIAIVKVGKNGSFIKKDGKKYKVGVIDVVSRDTTGAGDLYAGGFLYGIMNELSLDKAGKIGAVLSGNVIEVIGAKMDEKRWLKIKDEVNKIIA